MSEANDRTHHATLAVKLVGFAVGMFAFGFFVMPPLYDVFCEITGFGGRTNTETVAATEAPNLDREIRVEFMATVNNYAPWTLEADVDSMVVHPGKMYYVTYTATNQSEQQRVGQAVPSVAPVSATQHFQKIECFCFENQLFNAQESQSLPLQFIVDPELPEFVDTITLSYTYFETTHVTSN
ncbi:MAG: cytochrome c oxidase assembly protein [Pseudomonadota bacterium]